MSKGRTILCRSERETHDFDNINLVDVSRTVLPRRGGGGGGKVKRRTEEHAFHHLQFAQRGGFVLVSEDGWGRGWR